MNEFGGDVIKNQSVSPPEINTQPPVAQTVEAPIAVESTPTVSTEPIAAAPVVSPESTQESPVKPVETVSSNPSINPHPEIASTTVPSALEQKPKSPGFLGRIISGAREILNFGISPEANEAGKNPHEKLSPFTKEPPRPLEPQSRNT